MKATLLLAATLGIITGVILVAYYPLVFLNYTFTHDNLPDDNIPYYIHDNPADLHEINSNRFGSFWFVFATDTTRIFPPILMLIIVIVIPYTDKSFNDFLIIGSTIVIVVLGIWEIIKFIWSAVLLVPDNCEKHQFCRNFSSRRDAGNNEVGGDPRQGNYVYHIMVWTNLAIIIIYGIYLVILFSMTREEKVEKGEPEEKVEKGKPKAWISLFLTISSLTLGLLLVFYLPIVYFNFTFTHKDLPDDNIPHYFNDESAFMNIEEGDSGRFGLYWWIYASDSFLILVPIITLINLGLKIHWNLNFTILVQLLYGLVLLSQIGKFIWGAILAIPSLCDDHQFCRAFGSRRDPVGKEIGDNPRNLNYVYAIYMWFHLGFSMILLLNLFVISSMKGSLFRGVATRVFSGYESLSETTQLLVKRKERRIILKKKKIKAKD